MSGKSIETVEHQLQTLDITKLVEYTRKIRDIGSLNKMMAPIYLRDFIEAYDVTNSMLASAIKCELDADTMLKTAKSIAYLDKANDYLVDKGIKDSASAREKYVDLDPDVIKAANVKARCTALVHLLKNKMQEFRMAHDDVKKLVYGDNNGSSYEGM
jgi:hypothetical protein